MTSQTAKLNPPPAWKLWDNPVFLRYCRSRLRLKGLLPSLLLTEEEAHEAIQKLERACEAARRKAAA